MHARIRVFFFVYEWKTFSNWFQLNFFFFSLNNLASIYLCIFFFFFIFAHFGFFVVLSVYGIARSHFRFTMIVVRRDGVCGSSTAVSLLKIFSRARQGEMNEQSTPVFEFCLFVRLFHSLFSLPLSSSSSSRWWRWYSAHVNYFFFCIFFPLEQSSQCWTPVPLRMCTT